MANLLVTGDAGFIGSNFVRFWRKRYPEDALVILDAFTYAGNAANLHRVDDIELVPGDIRNTDLVRNLLSGHSIDTIVHFAAETHVDRSIDGPDAFIETNVTGTHSMLKAAKSVWLDEGTVIRIGSIISRRTKSMAVWAPTNRPFLKPRLMLQTHLIPPRRPRVTTSCAPITTPLALRLRRPVAQTITGRSSIQRS